MGGVYIGAGGRALPMATLPITAELLRRLDNARSELMSLRLQVISGPACEGDPNNPVESANDYNEWLRDMDNHARGVQSAIGEFKDSIHTELADTA